MDVITLTYSKAEQCAEMLINEIDFHPDLVIGVLNGAKFLIEEFKKSEKFTSSCFVEVKLQRESEKMKRNKIVSIILKILPYSLLNRLRIIESEKVKSKIKKIDFLELNSKIVILDNLPNIDVKKILIIDDALDSGKTIYLIKNELTKKYPNLTEIKSAVIAWTIDQSIVKPDYYVYKNTLVRYPWSKDFKH